MKQPDVEKLAEHYHAILVELGADTEAEGIKETPMRAAKALVDFLVSPRARSVISAAGLDPD